MRKNIFLLSWRKIWLIILIGFISIMAHNLVWGIWEIEEPFFFTIVVILIPLYLAISVIYSLVYHFKRQAKEDRVKKKKKRKK